MLARIRGSLLSLDRVSTHSDDTSGTSEEEWTNITAQDLPIRLDSPTSSSSTFRTPSRFSFSRLKKFKTKSRRRFPNDTRSILDAFPQPPSHIPTPVTPSVYRWPTDRVEVLSPSAEEESRKVSDSSPLKSLTRVLTRRFKRSKPESIIIARTVDVQTIVVRSPRPNRPPSDPLAEQHTTYRVVNPTQLTASPSPFISTDLTISARNSFVPPSPSWLSRNVQSIDPAAENDTSTPSSPPPLPIPPRILVSDCSPLLSPLEATADWFRQSFISVSQTSLVDDPEYMPHQQHVLPDNLEAEVLLLKPSTPFLSVPTPKAGIPSPLATPYSPSPSYLEFISRTSFHQLESDSIFDSPDSKPTLVSDSPPPREIFVPATSPDLSRDFSSLFSNFFIEAGLSITDMNFGKRNDVVDFGGEADYDNMEWFKEAPPPQFRPQQPVEPTGAPYVPDGAVIEQNESFEFALGAAPNVLYARYKQYGQLGVLAWCAEFGELIDNLKDLGFAGNMFVSTRTQALKTCEEILKLHLDIGMQIILLYLSSQVARLRRFLDGERVWDDYPEPSFPIDPNSYPK